MMAAPAAPGTAWKCCNRPAQVFLASDRAWAVSGELVAATGGAGRTVHY
jgi:hypothetical protein